MGNTGSHLRRPSITSVQQNQSQNKVHFNRRKVATLRQEFEKIAKNSTSITKEQFNLIIANHCSGGHLFFERLFDAFDTNGDKTIDCDEFIRGLSVFNKGTTEEKLELTFKIYDLNRDGHVTMNEINKVLIQIYSSFYNDDQSAQIKEMTRRLFEDLDINGDGELSLEEYKLSALKEPMIANFLDQFLVEDKQ